MVSDSRQQNAVDVTFTTEGAPVFNGIFSTMPLLDSTV